MASVDCQAHKMFPIKWAPLGLVVEPSRKRACSPKLETGLSGDGAGSSQELPKAPRFRSEGISKPPSSQFPRSSREGSALPARAEAVLSRAERRSCMALPMEEARRSAASLAVSAALPLPSSGGGECPKCMPGQGHETAMLGGQAGQQTDRSA